MLVRPSVTLLSSMPGRVPHPSPGSLGPARRLPFPGAERRLEVPQSVGRAGERLCGPEVAFTQLSGSPAGGGSGAGSSANSAISAGRGLAPTPAPAPESPGGRSSAAAAWEGAKAFPGLAPPAS